MDQTPRLHEALSRSNLYGLLARVTRAEVDAELLAEFRKPEVAAALAEAGADLSLALISMDDQVLLEDLARAYTHLFLLTLNPHESVQRGEGQLWGQRTVAAQAFLAEAGLGMTGEQALLPDHIATELSVMQVLAAEEASALAEGNETKAEAIAALQQRYLSEHLGAWGAGFFASAERLANHDFYRAIAHLGGEFLASETGAS